MTQRSDSHYYEHVGFRVETLRLFANALRFYAAALENDLAAIQMDPELAKLVDGRSTTRALPRFVQ